MAVLLTGGTGKTSVRIGRLLQDAKIPFLLASRRGEAAAPSGMPATHFNWLDSSTFANPFQHRFPGGEGISAIYLITPQVTDPTSVMTAFVDYAVKEHGVNRFVLMAGSTTEPGELQVGRVWQHLLDIGVEYCVLRPTWFMGVCVCPDLRYIFPLTAGDRKPLGGDTLCHGQKRGQDLYGVWRWQDLVC